MPRDYHLLQNHNVDLLHASRSGAIYKQSEEEKPANMWRTSTAVRNWKVAKSKAAKAKTEVVKRVVKNGITALIKTSKIPAMLSNDMCK